MTTVSRNLAMRGLAQSSITTFARTARSLARFAHTRTSKTSRRHPSAHPLWQTNAVVAHSQLTVPLVPSRGVRRRVKANTVINFVPQQEAWIVERMGKFNRVLSPGVAILVPFLDTIAYAHSLKMVTLEISRQKGITKDNVNLTVDGVLYYQIKDPIKASYEITDPQQAVEQLAMSTMRSQLGQMTLEQLFEERETLNRNIVESLNSSAQKWGIWVDRYEIRDIIPPEGIQEAMELQAVAERRKRQAIIESEGLQQSEINVATGKSRSVVINSEARMTEQININKGEAEAIRIRAEAVATAIERLASAIASPGGREAVSLRIAEQYVAAFANIAQTGNTILLPANLDSPAAMIAQAMGLYEGIRKGSRGSQPAQPADPTTRPPPALKQSPPSASATANTTPSTSQNSQATATSGEGPSPPEADDTSSSAAKTAAAAAGTTGLTATMAAALKEVEEERHAQGRGYQEKENEEEELQQPRGERYGDMPSQNNPRMDQLKEIEEALKYWSGRR